MSIDIEKGRRLRAWKKLDAIYGNVNAPLSSVDDLAWEQWLEENIDLLFKIADALEAIRNLPSDYDKLTNPIAQAAYTIASNVLGEK